MNLIRRHVIGALVVGMMGAGAALADDEKKKDDKKKKDKREALDLDPLMGGEAVWKMTDEEFAKKYIKEEDDDSFSSESFEWVSAAKQSARLRHLKHWQFTTFKGEGEADDEVDADHRQGRT